LGSHRVIRLLSLVTLVILVFANFGSAFAAVENSNLASQSAAGDPQFFSQTNFRVDDRFWDYFQKRGGVNNFGYPVSRAFQFLGSTVQFFQRRIVQLNSDGSVGQINLLDSQFMPYTSVNGATFPAGDPNVIKGAPAVGSPNYGTAVLSWILKTAPNSFSSMPVSFAQTFQNTVTMNVAYPNGGGSPGLLLGIDLEMWGVPISNPAPDPHNSNFIYQRFQRGIMHFDNTTHTTQGILLADYFKSILTGNNLPGDLASEAASSQFFKQYNPNAANWVNNPGAMPNTNLTNAFTTQTPAVAPAPGPAVSGGFRYGFQAQMLEGSIPQITGAINGAGFTWVKQQVRWSDQEPSNGSINFGGLDGAVNAANAAGISVLFSIVSAPSWAAAPGTDFPKNPSDFASFMSAMASHFKGRVAAYELWNEENFAREVGPGNINPGNYVELLKASYPAIKAADPNAVVLSGAPTPTGVNDPNIAKRDITYLQQMYAYQGGVVKGYFDVLGAHNEPYWNPPDQTVATATNTAYANDPSFFFRQVEDYHNLMASVGDGNKQIWETEIGYDSNPMAPAGYNGWTVSDQQQASYLVALFQYARTHYAWMGAIFVWNLNFQCIGLPQTDEKWGFSVLAAGYTPRPAYSALQAMPKI
jgi:hypothetical protein